jgi:hypothetical protein
MQGPTDEASIPTEHVINRLLLGVTVPRKAAKKRMLPQPAAAENPAFPPPPPEDEDLPAEKRARLQGPTTALADEVEDAHTAERVTTASPDDTPTDSVTPAASFTSATVSRPYYRFWKVEEDAKLTEAVQKLGKHSWGAVAAMVPSRTNVQCRERWKISLVPTNGSKKRAPYRRWKAEEDAKLIEAVKKRGQCFWKVLQWFPIERVSSVVSVGSPVWILPIGRTRLNGRQKKMQS